MDERLRLKQQRCEHSRVGWTLLIYFAVMNVLVMWGWYVEIIIYAVVQEITDIMLGNAWGYILAILLGAVIVLAWKGFPFWKNEIWAKERKMTVPAFFGLLCYFLSGQAMAQILMPWQEWLLNQVGLTAMASIEMATGVSDTVSMFLYVGFLGPVAEELLFRGLILRMLKPQGKVLAIVISSLLFGLFHGNFVQIPYAFLIGVVLGYTAVEYSIIWAIVLHIINNFVLSDLMSRLSLLLPVEVMDAVFFFILAAAVIGAVILTIIYRKRIAAYAKSDPAENLSAKAFITAPGILVFAVLMCTMALLTLTKL